ncbi:mediator of RNA polymerase 2 transcription subunit 19 [Grosmannia clavigera kw1407]|uniref:Mediator of RNA polymerase II transcription subunit 19 n=1 Tax=Grosmannia clavigera (strain kw1407 / UAMH 11150) TaxID=655863 RepID=F0XIM7_GROCL|nr:mediator of RNA polymerase 2 transcription subunit 19 [Grosmannia clavigera kw1407]EFX02486.1 mediator of RNA polymerase 2 transcription subunit 19 [Grosmannia clavigera kw1407]
MSFHPQTPQSPSQFSPMMTDPQSASSSSVANTINTNGASFASTATASTLPTPAHSVNGCNFGAVDVAHDMSTDDSPQKRKRAFADSGSQHPKKVHMEGQQRLDFEALHQDVGEKYLVGKKAHTPSFPPLSEDLFSMFGLSGIAAEVARTLPNGEKNAMRKTYKGYMKKLGVSGHFEPVKREDGDESDFLRMLSEAEDSWQARQVKTKEIQYGFADDVTADLRLAFTMNKGPMPKAIWDSSVLGDLAPDKLASIGTRPSSVRGTTPSTPLHPAVARSKTQQPSFQQMGPGGPDASRPRRVSKKRSYGDNSFEGYGEGFPDDDLVDGYSTGDGDGPSHKRRKKVLIGASCREEPFANPLFLQAATSTSQYPPAPVRQQSYGPGMVGA